MSEPKRCPTCGASSTTLLDHAVDAIEADVPPVELLASGSNDDTFLNMPRVPKLEPAHPAAAVPGPLDGSSVPRTIAPMQEPSSATPRLIPNPSFPTIDIAAPMPVGSGRGPVVASSADGEIDGDDEPDDRRTSWSTVLLASYASAMTLALGWTVIRDRQRDKATEVAPSSSATVVNRPESGHQAGLSRKVEPPEPILGEHFATFKKPLNVGSLEITPIEVKRQDVQLQRRGTYGSPDRRDGGKRALVLLLKLRNISNDAVFAPLDQSYLRERGNEVVDTYVETNDQQRIYPFPLAIESEWSIVGQDFSELRPGEVRTVLIVTAPDAPPDSAGPFTWRVRLRTGINRTDTIGVAWPSPPSSSLQSK